MKRGVLKVSACALAAGMTFTGAGSVAFASKDTTLVGFSGNEDADAQADAAAGEQTAETQETASQTVAPLDTSMSGQLAFAQCEEYINVRSGADAESDVVGKVYNNGSVTILGQAGDWYQVQSGNATGYVKADYFATGAEAQAIADEVAYNVATVYSEALNVRSEASEDSESIGTVYSNDELEVVDYDGEWMKVALGNDTYGYVNAYYVGYDTYYATAETLEEEQARLDQEWLDYLAESEAAEQQAQWDAEYAASQVSQDYTADYTTDYTTDYSYSQQQTQADAQWSAGGQTQDYQDAQASADAAYQTYLDAQAAADEATNYADEQAVYDTAAAAQAAYQEYLNAQAAADAAYVSGQTTSGETYTDNTYTEDTYTEPTYTEPAYTDTSSGTDAQANADAAYQAYLDAQAAADEATNYADEQAVYDTAAAAQAAYQEYLNAQAAADAAYVSGQTGANETYTGDTYTEDTYTEDTYTEDTSYEEPAYSSTGQSIVDFATQFVGNPYVWGGTSLTNGADCSGFTQSVFANFGISIPRTAASQSGSGTPVSLSDIQPGDLLFYEGGGGIGHVTIYMGGGQVVHASTSSTGIIISDYNYRTPVSARRYWS